jgi:hypothetical protein
VLHPLLAVVQLLECCCAGVVCIGRQAAQGTAAAPC